MNSLKRVFSWVTKRIFSWVFVKFGIVGAIGILVNFALYWALTSILGAHYLLAGAIATELAILNNFALNDIWTFRERRGGTRIIVRILNFHWSRLLGFLVTIGSTYMLVDLMGLDKNISYLFAIGLGTLTNFFTSDIYVWPEKELKR
ncbi:MAG: GtrA family protein [Nitrososphaeria archaeon]|nr:GtrA family protein [Nitrososphaeria archaeon]MDW8022037.1 GtrA family protein [Nitrososphaerota archaeon]